MNSLMTLGIYRVGKLGWAFDDKIRGIKAEPFVCGAPEIIDALAGPLRNQKALRLIFSAAPFPGNPAVLEHLRSECGGNWYRYRKMEGWLCPTLFAYFETAPKNIYVKVEAE